MKIKSEFSRNVLTLMTGTSIAQAIPIAISPILTRLYSPEDLGIFALYMAIASIVAVIATGRYELAIILPKKDEDAVNIVIISILVSFIVSFISFLIVFFFNEQLTHLLGNPQISNWLYFIPISVLFTGLYQSVNYWSNRKKQYKRLVTSRVIQSGTTATGNLSMGFGGFGNSGLILGGLIGQGVATTALAGIVYKEDKNCLVNVKKLKIMALMKKYIKFPKFDILASLLNTFSSQFTHILFNILFNPIIAGFYYLTQRVIGLPISIIAGAISDVFRQKASEDFKNFNNAKSIYISTFLKLFILALFPSIILYFFSVEIFIFVFGENWSIAGEFLKIMIPMLFIKFISSPLSFMLYIGEKQNVNMYSQMLFLIVIVISFLIGSDEYEVISYISIFFSLIYLYYLYLSAKIAKVF